MPTPLPVEDCAETIPYYLPIGDECELFELAYRQRLPLLLKGPTGCGKTRFVAHMAAKLKRPLYTIPCHDDLTAADLTGRYLLRGGDTVWVRWSFDASCPRWGRLLSRRSRGSAKGRHRRLASPDRPSSHPPT